METLVKADLFFFVTTIAVIIGSILIAVIFVYVIRILRNVTHVTERVVEESDRIIEDVEVLRSNVKKKGIILGGLFKLFTNKFKNKKNK